jgi:hypothetical protein
MGRKEIGELCFTSVGQLEVKGSSFGGPVKTEDEKLVDSEVDDLVERGRMFDFLVEAMKYLEGDLVPEDFSSNHTFHLIMICHLTGSNSR